MKGLLLKDCYASVKYFRMFYIICLLFIAAGCVSHNNMFFLFYPCLLSGMIPTNLLAYDEAEKWDVTCGTLPCSRAQFVSAKYLIGITAQVGVILLVGVSQTIRMVITRSFSVGEISSLLFLLVIISCASNGLTLPFIFKMGVQKGRMAYYVMVGMICGGSVLAGSLMREQMALSITYNTGLLIGAAASVVLYAGSWLLSVKWYEKRELNG